MTARDPQTPAPAALPRPHLPQPGRAQAPAGGAPSESSAPPAGTSRRGTGRAAQAVGTSHSRARPRPARRAVPAQGRAGHAARPRDDPQAAAGRRRLGRARWHAAQQTHAAWRTVPPGWSESGRQDVTELERRNAAALETPEQVMALIQATKADLQRVEDPREAIQIVKRANSIKYLTTKADASAEVQNQAAEVALRARRKAGELLEAIPRERGGDHKSDQFQTGHAGRFETERQKVLDEAQLTPSGQLIASSSSPGCPGGIRAPRHRNAGQTDMRRLPRCGRARRPTDRPNGTNQARVEETIPCQMILRSSMSVIDPPWTARTKRSAAPGRPPDHEL